MIAFLKAQLNIIKTKIDNDKNKLLIKTQRTVSDYFVKS